MSYQYAVIDIETTGLSRYKHKITWIGIGLVKNLEDGIDKIHLFNMSIAKREKKFLELIEYLRKHKVHIIWQGGKFDTLFILHHLGVLIPIHEDVLLLGTAYDMAGSHKLKDMAMKYLGVDDWDIATKKKTGGKAKDIKPYLTKDVQYTWELFVYLTEHMSEDKWMHYQHILRPAYRMYRDVEINGIYLNRKQFKNVKAKYEKIRKEKLEVLTAQYDINWNSSDQLQKVLFEEENLPVIKRSAKTRKPSANAEVLKRLAYDGYPIAKQILEYREADTLVKMFLNRWGDDASFDGRIHPNFGITNVRTGRTSCSDPNLQQVPRNKEVRSCFKAPPSKLTDGKKKVFFEADYSQLELRIAADIANDRTMIEIYRKGGDIHTSTARIFTKGKEPTKEDRNKAKAVNFG